MSLRNSRSIRLSPTIPTFKDAGSASSGSDGNACFEGFGEVRHSVVKVISCMASKIAKGTDDHRNDVTNGAIGYGWGVLVDFEIEGSLFGFMVAGMHGSCGHHCHVKSNTRRGHEEVGNQ